MPIGYAHTRLGYAHRLCPYEARLCPYEARLCPYESRFRAVGAGAAGEAIASPLFDQI